MAYFRRGPETYDGGDQSILVVRSVAGPDAREIPVPGISIRGAPTWIADGKIVAIGKGFPGGDWNAYSIDLESGDVQPLVGADDLGANPKAVSPDGREVYFGRDRALMAFDLSSRQERSVAVTGYNLERGPYLSPDGKLAALILSGPDRESTVLSVVSVTGGPMREVFRREAPDGISQSMGVFWAPGSDRLFFSTHGVPVTNEPERLWTADISGSTPRVRELQGVDDWKGAADLAVSPGGDRIAFVSGQPRGEVWMMTNLSGGGR